MLRTLLVFTLCCLCLLPPTLYADQAQVVRIEPQLRDGQLLLDADIEFTLGSELKDAAEKGVPLYFTADLHIVRPRWWWLAACWRRRCRTRQRCRTREGSGAG